MKKLTALLLALVMVLSLTACSFVMLPEEQDPPADPKQEQQLAREGTYTTKEDVALYIHLYGRLPDNFITKKEAQQLGWTGGSLEPYAPGCCIGGSRFGNYEGRRPHLDRVRHQHPGGRFPGSGAHRVFQRRPDLLHRRPLQDL